MRNSIIPLFLFSFAVPSALPGQQPNGTSKTALDRYVAKKDDAYKWDILHSANSEKVSTIFVDLKSQRWRTKDEVHRTLWQHWVRIIRPMELKSKTALILIGGGANGKNPPKDIDEQLMKVAMASGTVVVELGMIPNQPLIFHGDGKKRTEDDLIGYTWVQYLKTGDDTWPARLPMVKSVVRAMDAVQEILNKDGVQVQDFVVAGGSKRGWTTWMTAAVDKRVVGIAPIVIDVVNVEPSMNHHYAAYGFWAPAVGDYVHHKLTHRRNWPEYRKLLHLVDPYFYRARFTMPKCIINSAGDQFFLPDSSQFYFDDLVGEKMLSYTPNSDHSLNGSNAIETLLAFHFSIAHKLSRPKFTWKQEDNTLFVDTSIGLPNHKLNSVTLWQATNPDARDFRLEKIGKAYSSTDLTGKNGIYQVDLQAPQRGWTASFVQLEFEIGAPVPIRLSTPVYVTPEVLPFKDKVAPTIPKK